MKHLSSPLQCCLRSSPGFGAKDVMRDGSCNGLMGTLCSVSARSPGRRVETP